MKGLHWKCDACKKERPDEFISVLSYPIKGFDEATHNLKYCNDKDSCYWIAKDKALTGKI